MSMPMTQHGVKDMVTNNGGVVYMSNEHMLHEKEQLERLKARPHDGNQLANHFSHGINSHLPDGVSAEVDSTRYEKDAECKLVMDRIPGLTSSQLGNMRTMLRELAPDVVAYSMEQITGYNGIEPPMRIDLSTTAPIFCPPGAIGVPPSFKSLMRSVRN
jgi:hypothetical protein